jgi:hypothetical protein
MEANEQPDLIPTDLSRGSERLPVRRLPARTCDPLAISQGIVVTS